MITELEPMRDELIQERALLESTEAETRDERKELIQNIINVNHNINAVRTVILLCKEK
jgi:hypothetical protein